MKKNEELFEGTNEQLNEIFKSWADIFSAQKPKKMKIVEFESGSLLDEFKEGAEWRMGRHYEEFFVTGYTEEDEAVDLKFGAVGVILDQSEIDNLEIDLLAIDGEKEIDPTMKLEMEYQLKGLFEL